MWGDVISLKNEAISGLDSKGLSLRVLLQGLEVFSPAFIKCSWKRIKSIKLKFVVFSLVWYMFVVLYVLFTVSNWHVDSK